MSRSAVLLGGMLSGILALGIAVPAFSATQALPVTVTGSTTWSVASELPPTNPPATFSYGTKPLVPVIGDWDGDGDRTPGSYENGHFKLSNTLPPGAPTIDVTFGDTKGFPVVGDWNDDGFDDVAVYRNGAWTFRVETGGIGSGGTVTNPTGFTFGTGSWPTTVPVAGDWDGDGLDGIGIYTYASGNWQLRQTPDALGTNLVPFTFWAGAGTLSYPVVGDWNADTIQTVGVKAGTSWQLNDQNDASAAEHNFTFGMANDLPLVGGVFTDIPPTAVDDSATVLEDDAATAVPVLANDTDPDGGPMTISSATDPSNGTVVLTGGSPGAHTGLTYQPDANYCNAPPGTTPDTFDYTLNGGSTATVSVTVTCVNDAPVADDETFNGNSSAHGNTTMVVDDPSDGAPSPSEPKTTVTGDILDGDTDIDGPGPLTVTPGTFATNDGGSVTIEADGDFTFRPAASTSCTDTSDSFNYTVEDSGSPEQTDTGTVTIAIAGCVWYVSNNFAGAPDNQGTAQAPFDTLAQAEAASGNNHTVFVYDGDNTATGYDAGGYQMNSGERLIGEHEGLVVDPDGGGSLTPDTLRAANPGAHPTLTANNADVIALDDGNEIRGINVDAQGTGGGIFGGAGDTGGAILDDINVVEGVGSAGQGPGLELDGTTGTFNVTNLAVSNAATGIRLNNAGTTDFGSTTVTTTTGPAFTAAGTNMSTSTFDSLSASASTGGGVVMLNTTGSTTFGDGAGTDLALTTASGAPAAFQLTNAGTITVPAGGTANLSATGGPAVDVTGTSGASLSFDDVSSSGSANDGINLDGLGSGTFSAASGTISGASAISFDLNGGAGTITYPGTLGNGGGTTAIDVTGRSGGTVTLSGPIQDTNDAGGTINIANNTSGSTTLSNGAKRVETTSSNNGVTLSSNTGHTVNLTGGGLDVDSESGTGFSATGGGTVTVTGTANTIDSTSAPALNVTSTNIGATGMTFQRLSSGNATAATDPANGIVLNATGANPLTVTGLASSAQGGDNSGGTIQNTTGHGIALTNTTTPSFRNMNLQNTGDSGVNGTQVTGFSFTDGRINGAGNADDENSITFDDSLGTTPNLTGVVTITNNVISQTEAEGVDIHNFAGTITNANVSNNALSDTGDVATPGSAISLLGGGTATTSASITKATVANNTITDFRAGAGIQIRANPNAGGPAAHAGIAGDATNVIAVTGNLMNGGSGGINNQPDRFFTGGAANNAQGNFNISNNGTAANRIRNIDCIAIEVQKDGPSNMTSTVSGNFINANSAVGCAGIAVGTDDPGGVGAGTHSTTISSNNVMGTDGPGIFPIVRGSTSTMVAKVLNNTVAAPITTNAARAGIRVDSGSAVGDTTLCLEISGNTTAGSTNSGTGTTSPGINLRKQGTSTTVNEFDIEGMAATATPGVENYVNSLNTSTSGTFGVNGTALLSATSGFGSCTAP